MHKIKFESLFLDSILAASPRYSKLVKDEKDTAILVSVILARPDYFISGDRNLRLDLLKDARIRQVVKVCCKMTKMISLSEKAYGTLKKLKRCLLEFAGRWKALILTDYSLSY